MEQVVKYVKTSFFNVRYSFADVDDLQAQLAQRHIEVNDELVNRATGQTPRQRMKTDVSSDFGR